MTRPAPGRASACLLAVLAALACGAVGGVLGTGVTAPAPASADEGDEPPLAVSIETLAPATIPQHGRVRLSGVVTNRSDHTWRNLKAYLVVSASPLRTPAELAEAAASDPETEIGGRIAEDGLYPVLGDLEPGAAVPYQLSVPRSALGIDGSPGVYWVGVHVLGEDDAGRDLVADGRARTFMPLLTPAAERQGAHARMSLLVPVEDRVRRGATGRLLGVGRWERSVGTDGRLDRLLRLSANSTEPFTWVVDPAVLDAVGSVAHDNPGLDTGPSNGATGQTPSPSGSPSPSPSGTPTPTDGAEEGGTDAASPEAQAAQDWLTELRRQAPRHSVAGVPYGGLDAAAVLRARRHDVYADATRASADALRSYGVDGAAPVLDPAAGALPDRALRRVPTDTTVLLDGGAYADEPGPVLRQTGRPPVVLVDAQAGDGGPRPNSRYSALAVRQRLLSEAALHAISADRDRTLVVRTPTYWNPGSAWRRSGFFSALQQPWLEMVDLPALLASDQRTTTPRSPAYSRADRSAELPRANVRATRRLVRAGAEFAELLADNDTVDDSLAKVAVLGSSATARGAPRRAAARVDSSTSYVRAQMDRVHVEGPPFVMMSSQDGPISVRLVNDLDQPVTVGVEAHARGGRLQVSKGEPVRLGPGERTAIRLEARSTDIGVHSVTVFATTADGTPVGGTARFNVRTSHVSTVIWVIMAAGGAVLFLAIGVRLFRRLRRRRRTHGPLLPRADTPSTADPADPSGPHDRIGA